MWRWTMAWCVYTMTECVVDCGSMNWWGSHRKCNRRLTQTQPQPPERWQDSHIKRRGAQAGAANRKEWIRSLRQQNLDTVDSVIQANSRGTLPSDWGGGGQGFA